MDGMSRLKEFNLVVAGEQDMGRRKGERDLAAFYKSLQELLNLKPQRKWLSKNEVLEVALYLE